MAWLPLPWPSRYVNITCYTWLQCVRSQMGVCTQSQLFSLPLISIVQFPSIQIFNLSNLWLWRCFPYCPSYWKMSRCRNNKPNSYTFMCCEYPYVYIPFIHWEVHIHMWVWIPVRVHRIQWEVKKHLNIMNIPNAYSSSFLSVIFLNFWTRMV